MSSATLPVKRFLVLLCVIRKSCVHFAIILYDKDTGDGCSAFRESDVDGDGDGRRW